jgi:L-ascorbate metabolism protein UlaG (beta-lactamase superfamily)
MRITKLEHAALRIESSGSTLIVDPGAFTTPITEASGVVAVVLTHEHPDHWTPEQLNRILAKNPDLRIFAPEGVAAAASDFVIEVVHAGDEIEVDPFTLRFFGGRHAEIHRSIPIIDNVGVLVNGTLYYPGDSFAIPEGVEVDTLATPAVAPWLKISEVIDFVEAVKPKRSFPTHDMLLSQIGRTPYYGRIQEATERGGGEFFPLQPGEALDV